MSYDLRKGGPESESKKKEKSNFAFEFQNTVFEPRVEARVREKAREANFLP